MFHGRRHERRGLFHDLFHARTLRLALPLAAGLGGLACRPPPPPPPPPPPVVARVDGAPIPLAALQREVTRVRRGESPDGGTETASTPAELARALLGPIIDRQLLAARARADGLSISEAEIQRATDVLADDARRAGEGFPDRLARDGETETELHDETREQLLAEAALAKELRVEAPTPAEVKSFAEQHKSESEPEEVRCAQILVASPEEAKSLLDRLRAGERFDVLARDHSLSPDARQGGDLGFFPRGRMPPPFDDTCFGLKPGQLSGIVRSDYGFHVFKLLERRAARKRPLEEVARPVAEQLFAERATQARAALLQALREKAKIEIDEAQLAQIK